MDPVTLEMLSLYSGDPLDLYLMDDEDELAHGSSYEAQGKSVSGPGGRTAEASSNGIGSGRYRKGSGSKPYQHGIGDFLERVDFYKKSGVKSEKELAALCGFTKQDGTGNTTTFRVAYQRELHTWKKNRAAYAQSLLDKGMTKKAVANELGIRDSTLNSWLNPKSLERVNRSQSMADFLQKQVDEKKMIDVGAGVEKELNISKTKLTEAIAILQDKEYQLFGGRVPQATNPGQKTTLSVLAAPDQKWSDVYNHPEMIQSVKDYIVRENLDGKEYISKKWQYPASLDSSRLMIRYADDPDAYGHTGVESDGTLEIRRNVPDLDLQGSRYAQVRILVDNKKYLKGMAHYSDNMPDGIDVIFNTNKTRDQADIVLKKIKADPNNPFGALLRKDGGQYMYEDPKTGEMKLGLINKTRQEGDWEEWKDSLPSQFLAKQPMALINKQLGLAIADKKAELADIMKLNNPTVKKSLLLDFADGCDSDAVHMQAASLPRQKYQVILPVPTLKDDEVYAPNFKDGETIALIRFPHQGIFEIPILKVNNRNPQGKEIMGENPMDAIGVNQKNAGILSGADFDGDTVMCVPCNDPKFGETRIMNRPPLEGLEGFEPKDEYAYDRVETRLEKVKKIDKQGNVVYGDDGKPVYEEKNVDHYFRNGHEFKQMTRTGLEMGKVSNLMMDMTLKGADDADLAMVARHAQVVIDAEKHHLDWQASELDNHIKEMKKKYQERVEDEDGSIHYGASTLITRAKSPTQIVKPTGTPHIDPETGKLVYTEKQLTPQTYIDKKTGKEKTRMEDAYLLDTKDNAFDLVFDKNNPKEVAYATYANTLRAMANEARKEYLVTGDITYNKQAEEKYHEEAEHLLSELMISELNAPRERMAQLYSRSIYLSLKDNPDITKKELKKAADSALAEGRTRFGASRHKIDISPREWEAIQSGAIKKTNLEKILKYADSDKVRQYATPKDAVALTTGQKARIRAALDSGKSAALLAEQYNVSVSTINQLRKGEE